MTNYNTLTHNLKRVFVKKLNFSELGTRFGDGKYIVFSPKEMTISLVTGPTIKSDKNNYKPSDEIMIEAIYKTIKDIHKKLELPDSLYSKIMQTSKSDGTQKKSFENIMVTWSYAPTDYGTSVLYEYK